QRYGDRAGPSTPPEPGSGQPGRCVGFLRQGHCPGDESRTAGHAAALALPGRCAVVHEGGGRSVPGRRTGRGLRRPDIRNREGGGAVTATDLGLPQLGGLDDVPTTDESQKAKDFKSDQEVRWCPGCGDYVVL